MFSRLQLDKIQAHGMQLSLALALLSLGILLSVQFRVTQEAMKTLSAQSPQALAVTLKSQTEKKYNLQRDQWSLQTNLKALDSSFTQRKDVVKSLQSDLDDMTGTSGSSALTGPGIKITIPASTPIVTDELISIINELWNVGAEGVTVNGIRVTSYSAVLNGAVNTSLVTFIDKHALHFPYIIEAVGDQDKMMNGINIAGGTVDLLRVQKTTINVERSQELTLPAGNLPSGFKYARVTDQQIPSLKPGESPP